MNKNLEQIVQNAINQIKQLSFDKIQIIKSEFDKIHQHAISADESWYNLIKDNFQDIDIEDEFKTIGHLISNPARGPLNILKDAYEEDKPSDLDLFEYQDQVKDEIYQIVVKI